MCSVRISKSFCLRTWRLLDPPSEGNPSTIQHDQGLISHLRQGVVVHLEQAIDAIPELGSLSSRGRPTTSGVAFCTSSYDTGAHGVKQMCAVAVVSTQAERSWFTMGAGFLTAGRWQRHLFIAPSFWHCPKAWVKFSQVLASHRPSAGSATTENDRHLTALPAR